MTSAPFFSRYPQEDVRIRQYPCKSPMFFRDMNFMGAVFSADLSAIKESLPDRRLRPLEIFPGKGLAAIHCLEYKDSDIGPYNEVSLSLALRPGSGLLPRPSQWDAMRSIQTQTYHAYVEELPVTTEAALYGGLDVFNYPKYLADITFRETAAHRVCTVRDKATLDLILEFEGRKIRTRKYAPARGSLLSLNTYPKKDGRTLHARLLVNQLEKGMSFLINDAAVRLGRHPKAASFKRLQLGWQLEYVYAPKCEAILFKPEVLSRA